MKPAKTVTLAVSNPFGDARRASVPLILYETSDPAATIAKCIASLNGNAAITPMLQWDVARQLSAVNPAGQTTLESFTDLDPMMIANPVDFLTWLNKPEQLKQIQGAIFFVHNLHRMIDELGVLQGLWNLRDSLKKLRPSACIVGLVVAGSKLPVELASDFIQLSDPKPGPAEASKIIRRIAEAAKAQGAEIDPEKESTDVRVIDSTLGASGFGIEQVVSMSVRKIGLDRVTLGERQRNMIQQTKGLSVMEVREKISDIAGHKNAIAFLTGLLSSGRTPVNGIAFIDEIDKSLGAGQGESSGTSEDQRSVFLKVTQDYAIPALMLIGPGGTGKSLIAKAAGSISGALTIAMDLGAAKGSLVGESEKNVRAMFETLIAATQGKLLLIATCNRMAALTPEIRRRFKQGTFFVDLLSADERAVCWKLKRAKFSIPDDDDTQPAAEGWTGAEIEACCENAYRMNTTLGQAAQYVCPVCISAKEEIENLRKGASNRFISARSPGLYKYSPINESLAIATEERALNL